MLKRLVLIAVVFAVFAAIPASALDFDEKQFYGQGILALPIGSFGDFANIGLGAGFGILVPHTPEFSFRGEISYIYFTTEDIPEADVSASLIPITVLAQYNLTDSKAYLLGGLGFAIAKASVDFTTTIPGFDSSYSGSSTEFGLTLGGGFKLSDNFNLEGRFNLISDANSISVNAVYLF